MPDTSWGSFGWNLARRPDVAQRMGSFGRELASIATGTSDRAPAKADKRFSDPAWQGNPLLKRSMQAYLAAIEVVDSLFAEAKLDWRDAERIRFALDVVMEGLSPSNHPLISPQATGVDDRLPAQRLGGDGLTALSPAPGSYVHER